MYSDPEEGSLAPAGSPRSGGPEKWAQKSLQRKPDGAVRERTETQDPAVIVATDARSEALSQRAAVARALHAPSAVVVGVDTVPATLDRPNREAVRRPGRTCLCRERGVGDQIGPRFPQVHALPSGPRAVIDDSALRLPLLTPAGHRRTLSAARGSRKPSRCCARSTTRLRGGFGAESRRLPEGTAQRVPRRLFAGVPHRTSLCPAFRRLCKLANDSAQRPHRDSPTH
jgi:hypothetical protein